VVHLRKTDTTESCLTCKTLYSLGRRKYKIASGGIDYWCGNTGRVLTYPRTSICDDWKEKGCVL